MIKVAIPITGQQEYKALKKIIFSGKFVSGKTVEIFEKDFAKFIGTKYAICMNSGTAALHAALSSINLKPNDEVIVPAMSFISTATAVLHQRCKPIFCDVNLNNYCMSPDSFKEKITNKTKAVIPVHFAGSSCDMNKISRIAKQNNIKVIEDCSQAHGTKYFGKTVGNFGEVSCFSFYATKHMTTGEGGILCTNQKKIYEYCKSFRNHGMIDRDTHKFLGYNYRMGELNAAIGIVQLKKLKRINSKRIENSLYILKKLKKNHNKKKWFEIQEPLKGIYHTYFWCPIRILSKSISLQTVKQKLKKKGIEIRSRYKFPLYKQKVFQDLKIKSSQNYKKLYLKNAEKLSGRIFGLPNHYKLNKQKLNYIIKTLGNLFEK
jgi:perosamine synthetase